LPLLHRGSSKGSNSGSERASVRVVLLHLLLIPLNREEVTLHKLLAFGSLGEAASQMVQQLTAVLSLHFCCCAGHWEGGIGRCFPDAPGWDINGETAVMRLE